MTHKRGVYRAAFSLCMLLAASCVLKAADPGLNPFGVSSSAEASGQYRSWMPRMAAAGVKWVRVFPEWNQIQPAADRWDWSTMDAMLEAAAEHKLEVSGLFLYNASWINRDTHTFPTNHYPAWSTYVSNVVRHAAGRVRYWEVWNEPQSFAHGGTAADYARVVTNAYHAAKSADPKAQVGLSVASVDILYLEQTILAGAADHFDFICIHPYETLGNVRSGQEAQFMSIVPTVRKMLGARNPARRSVPIWFTEIGAGLEGGITPGLQAELLVKAYTLSIAQGVSCIQWFEAQEGGYKMGLLDRTGQPSPAFTALRHLATQLGPNPLYKGWVLLNNTHYGFVFQGVTNTVMAAWTSPGRVDSVRFNQAAEMLDPVDGSVAKSATCSLSPAPVLVIGVPSSLLSQAERNRDLPLSWGGDYRGATSVSVSLPNVEKGLHPLKSEAVSSPVMVDGATARDCSASSSVAFTVDPSFLSYTPARLRISAVVRRVSPGEGAGFNLKYEATTGFKGIGWNSVPAGNDWHTLTWTIDDAQFVGKWGYHFSFDSDSTQHSRYYLREVTVSKLPDARGK